MSRSRDQERDLFRMLTEFHDQVPGRLGHPPVVWVGGDAKDPHPLEGVFDDGEDVDGGAVEQGDGEEVGRSGSPSPDCVGTPPGSAPTCSARRGPRATYDDAVAVLEDAARDPGLPAGPGRGDREDPGGAGRDPGRAGQPARDSLTRGPCQVPTADARDGRRGHQPWSVITTPVSA